MEKALFIASLSKRQPTINYLHSPVGTCFVDFSKSILFVVCHEKDITINENIKGPQPGKKHCKKFFKNNLLLK